MESVENAINEFYKLKNKYETEMYKHKKKIMNNPQLSSKEKRSEFQKLKPKCVNCARPGGTLFSIHFYSDSKENQEYRELRAMCGILTHPCNLDIKIQIGKYESLTDILQELEQKIQEVKNEVIDDKNKLLFGFMDTENALQQFDTNKEYISELTSLLDHFLTMYYKITDNTEKKTEQKESIEMSYDLIHQIKTAMQEYDNTNNVSFVRDAVNVYVHELKPLLQKISLLTYAENTVSFHEDTNTYHLLQKKHTIQNLENTAFHDKVVKYNVGYVALKPKRGLILESSSSEEADMEGDIPTYANNTVTWKNEKYQSIWNHLSVKMKDALQTDSLWLQEFMDHCVSLREKKEPCTFVSPPSLKIPP